MKENINESNIIILIEKNIYDFKYKILTYIDKKQKEATNMDSNNIKEKESMNLIHIYEAKKQLMKNKYINVIIYEHEKGPTTIGKNIQKVFEPQTLKIKEIYPSEAKNSINENFSSLEILIIKINVENIKEDQQDIIKEIEEISGKFNNFKSYKKIYLNVNNKLIYFDKDCCIKDGKYEALKTEIGENIKKMKLKKEIASQESQAIEIIKEKYKCIENYIFENEKEIEKIKKYFNIYCTIKDDKHYKKYLEHLNEEKNYLEKKEKEIKIKKYKEEVNEVKHLEKQLEFLKEKNNILNSLFTRFRFPKFIKIKIIKNGGENIYVDKFIDENYDVDNTIDKLAKKIDKSENNIRNIYFLGIDEIITIYKNNLKGEEIVESLKSEEKLKEKVSNTIEKYKINKLSEAMSYVEDELFFEKIKNIDYQNEIIK